MFEDLKLIIALSVAGLVAGLGTLLASEEKLTPRIIIGRMLSSVALGVAAAAIVVIIPGVSFAAQVGIACGVASLGTSFLERFFQRMLQK